MVQASSEFCQWRGIFKLCLQMRSAPYTTVIHHSEGAYAWSKAVWAESIKWALLELGITVLQVMEKECNTVMECDFFYGSVPYGRLNSIVTWPSQSDIHNLCYKKRPSPISHLSRAVRTVWSVHDVANSTKNNVQAKIITHNCWLLINGRFNACVN